MAWFFLFLASCFEVCWIFSLKALNMKKITTIDWLCFFKNNEAIQTLLPLLGYIAFGLGNIYFFSQAMKTVSASTAFAVWMAMALIFTKLFDVTLYNQSWNWQQLFFMLLILVGIMGLKWFE